MSKPSIYVACLASYNAGRLHGEWITLDPDPEVLREAIARMLASSPAPGAEEYAIHDEDGLAPYRAGEYPDLDTLARVAALHEEHGHAALVYAASEGDDEATLARFEDAYAGQWDSLDEYVEEACLADALDEVPAHLRPYIDVARYGRDLELGGEIWTHRTDVGALLVFRTC